MSPGLRSAILTNIATDAMVVGEGEAARAAAVLIEAAVGNIVLGIREGGTARQVARMLADILIEDVERQTFVRGAA